MRELWRVCLDSPATAGALSPSLALPFCLQIINFREPVTLDFLDAELEDENKEEVGRPGGSSCDTGWTPNLLLQRSLRLSSLPWEVPHPKGTCIAPVGPRRGQELGHCPLGASPVPPALHPLAFLPLPRVPWAARPCTPQVPVPPCWDGCQWAHGQALLPSVASSVSPRSGEA